MIDKTIEDGNGNDQELDSARSNFLVSHRESVRIFSTNRAELGKEENPGPRKRLCNAGQIFPRRA